MIRLGFVLLVLSSVSFADEKKGLSLVVTPFGSGPLSCKFEPTSNPPVVDNNLIHFKVTVVGGTGPYEWRMPLYKSNNGFNDVTLARVGKVTLSDDRSFPVDLNVSDLEKTGDKEKLEVMVRSHERFEARCSTPAKVVRQLATSAPAKELILQGGVSR